MAARNEKDSKRAATQDVNRILDVGRLLLSVLTQDELVQLQQLMGSSIVQSRCKASEANETVSQIGNTGVT